MPNGSERDQVGPSEPEKKGQRQSSTLSSKSEKVRANSNATHNLKLTESTHLAREGQARRVESQTEHPLDSLRPILHLQQRDIGLEVVQTIERKFS